MADQGWIKFYRSIRSNWLWENGNERYAKWWMDILLDVNHSPRKTLINGKLVEVGIGEKKTSILKLSERWGTSRNTVKKFLDLLEEDNMISRKSRTTDGTTLKVLHYADYQSFNEKKSQRSKQETDQQTDQRSDHKQELKELKNNTPKVDYKKLIDYLNLKTGKHFKNVESNRKLVRARLNDGYSKADIKKVIDIKSAEWKNDPDHYQYLQPSTLFAPSHFDNYLNQGFPEPQGLKKQRGSAERERTATDAAAEQEEDLKAIEEKARRRLESE